MTNITTLKAPAAADLDEFGRRFYLFAGTTRYPAAAGRPGMIVYRLYGRAQQRLQTIEDARRLVLNRGLRLEVISNSQIWKTFIVREAAA